ncbi:MAG: phosphoenolpyruvate--protein phosphotransferase [Clostridia bacterium]|nr:phosphoenolpyruvate--protein phosphotransferase [Clostridia bacterium]
MSSLDKGKSTVYFGVGINSKKAHGKIRFYNENTHPVSQNEAFSSPTVKETRSAESEKARFFKALEKTVEKTKKTANLARTEIGEDEAQIFEIHAMLLEDEDFLESVVSALESGLSAERAVEKSAEDFYLQLRALGDEYLSARASDIKDIAGGLLLELGSKAENCEIEDDGQYILVSEDLTPSQTVRLDKNKILGFITFSGTPTSHASILAKAMGIPAVVGAQKIPTEYDGKYCLLDASSGKITVAPSESEKREFLKMCNQEKRIDTEHDKYMRSLLNTPAVTRSGHKVMIYANIGAKNEVDGALLNGAEGIGLYRSELSYLSRRAQPTEDELYSEYREVVEKMQGRRVIIRTLDVGADKQAPYLGIEKEENPSLGFRGVRFCLENKNMFLIQLRAILRASAHGRVGIMIPMISTLDELRRTRLLIKEAMDELLLRGQGYDKSIELGIMIETPASAIMADAFAKEVDFFSVGTNDLLQYTLAADRQNSKVSHLTEEAEAVLRLIKNAAEAIHENDGWIGVCGEMAADLRYTQELVSIGVDELSVSPPYLLGIRQKVCDSK